MRPSSYRSGCCAALSYWRYSIEGLSVCDAKSHRVSVAEERPPSG